MQNSENLDGHREVGTRSRNSRRISIILIGVVVILISGLYEKSQYLNAAVETAEGMHIIFQNRVEAQRKFDEGEALRKTGSPESALEKYKETLPLWQAINDPAKEAKTLNNIGLAYDQLSAQENTLDREPMAKEKALVYYKQAQRLYCKVGDYDREAETLNNIGIVYSELNEGGTANYYFDLSRRAASDRGGESGAGGLSQTAGCQDDY